jgi:glycerol uptake operon antiterminator
LAHAESNAIAPYLTRPVIPYVTELADGSVPLIAPASIIFIGGGELAGLPALLEQLNKPPLAERPVLLHIDLLSGLANDEAGLRYVATLPRVDGIITVRHHLAPLARKLGLMSVVRLFLQDGRAVDRGLSVIEKSRPDAVELLPGVAVPQVADRFRDLSIPFIAGGLVRTPEAVKEILATGCKAVSTTNAKLWEMNAPLRR